MSKGMWIFCALMIIVLIGAWWFPASILSFRDLGGDVFTRLLIPLLAISLLVERFLDVFLTTWRAASSERLDFEIQRLESEIQCMMGKDPVPGAAPPADLAERTAQLERSKEKKREHRSATRVTAMWSGLTIGFAVSALGVRTLHGMITAESYETIGGIQKNLFDLIDMLLTGGLIAGGSDGIHKLMNLFRVFVEQTTDKASRNGAGNSLSKQSAPTGT